ncbi:MAG: hypothetical protein KJZ78_30015, partial [Bryobacteraceae bacterium]|nr:hypothetical protein [Bryobacteraceae bacterium]
MPLRGTTLRVTARPFHWRIDHLEPASMSDTAGANSRSRLQFSLATLLLSAVTVAVCCAWWQDHTSGQRQLDRAVEAARFGKLKLYEQLRGPETIGMAVTQFPEIRKFADKTFDEGTMPELWKQLGESRAGQMECSPKADPHVMRVPRALG